MSGATQYIGSKISLISKSDIRYEGILYTIDPVDCTIALAKVKSMGTEDRPTDRPVSARNEVYEYIVFRGSDIRDIRVCQPPKPQPVLAGGLPNDPAILQHSVPGTSTQTNEPGSTTVDNGLGTLMSGMRVKNDAPVDLTTSGSSVSAQPPGLSLLPLPNFPPSAAPRSTHDKTDTNTSTTQPGSPVNRPRNANNQNNSPQRRQNRQQQSNSTAGRYQNDFHFPQHQQNGYQNRGFQNYRDHRGFEPRGFDSYHLDRRPFNFDQGFNQGRSNMGFRGGRVDFPNRNRGFDNRRGFEDRRMSSGFGGNFGGRQNFDYGYNNFGGGMRFGGNQYGHNFGGGGGGGMNAGNQQRRNSSRQWFAGVGGGGNGNVGGTGMDNRRDSESGGGGGGGGQRKLTFSEEFDFESANTEFEHLMEKFSEVKIDNTESAAAESAGDKKASEEEKDGDKKDQSDSKSDDENVGKETVKKTYDPTISFFDNLSNAPPKTNNMDRNRLVKLNLETFGERGRSRPGRRQSINNIPGAQNYRFRGDFLYANNYRAYGNNFNNRFRGFNNRMIEGRMDFRDRFGNGGLYLRNPRY